MNDEQLNEYVKEHKWDTIAFCISMIHSIIAYGYDLSDDDILNDHYLQKYIKELGKEKVESFVKSTRNQVDHIERNVYTDSEGCSYNSIVWR